MSPNYAIGTLTALRGTSTAYNRLNVAEINTSATYNSNSGSLSSIYNNAVPWKLKTCMFNGKKYLALDVPYEHSLHNLGFKFVGWTLSTGEGMLAVPYEANGSLINQSTISDIQDFAPQQTETHDAEHFNMLGDVGIGTTNSQGYKLAVAGNMIAESVKVKLQGTWPDFVFAKDYELPTLQETEKYIKDKGHLPGIPSAAEVEKNGIELGDINKKLLQKIEELTLYLIEKDKKIQAMEQRINKIEQNHK